VAGLEFFPDGFGEVILKPGLVCGVDVALLDFGDEENLDRFEEERKRQMARRGSAEAQRETNSRRQAALLIGECREKCGTAVWSSIADRSRTPRVLAGLVCVSRVLDSELDLGVVCAEVFDRIAVSVAYSARRLSVETTAVGRLVEKSWRFVAGWDLLDPSLRSG
jgi:hypothetical protein